MTFLVLLRTSGLFLSRVAFRLSNSALKFFRGGTGSRRGGVTPENG